ncbi:MAG: dihydropteroate synthase [Acidobacteriia bacterium]|nr:dihydropteroate synthase [Terriglobia bacterium]
MPRKRSIWKLHDREIQLGDNTLLAGVLNVTPDSFSDGGQFFDPDLAYARALQMEEQGADIIDIGAESTRPGAKLIDEEEEIRRLIPVLKRLRGKLAIPISVDTYKSNVAARAIELGAEIINDPSGLTLDPSLAKVVSQHNAGLIINHMRGTPDSWARLGPLPDASGTVRRELDACVHRARRAGMDLLRIVIDPGLGFGKRKDESARLIADLRQLEMLNLPIHIGPSRKSFLAQTSPQATLMGTAAAVTACVLHGAHIVRVHDVLEMLPVVQVADSILHAAP